MDFEQLFKDDSRSKGLTYYEHPTQCLEIAVREDTSASWCLEPPDPPSHNDNDYIKKWLSQSDFTNMDSGKSVIGRLRLLIQIWKPDDEIHNSWYRHQQFPFTEEMWHTAAERLQLPRFYKYELVRRASIPVRILPISGEKRNCQGIICQSPNFSLSFITLVLSYDPISNITSGFLGGMVDNDRRGPISRVLTRLKTIRASAIQPMLLPILIYSVTCDQYSVLVDQGPSMNDNSWIWQMTNEKRGAIFDSVYNEQVDAHEILTGRLTEFVADLGACCKLGFEAVRIAEEKVESNELDNHSRIRKNAEEGLKSYLDHLLALTKSDIQRRDIKLLRINFQLQVMYNYIQQNIARDTKRDSSAMKSIALLTMVFLPTTALATIFSMDSFFFRDEKLRVSSDFWIFWVVALPVTALVLIIWIIWIQRDELWRLPEIKRFGGRIYRKLNGYCRRRPHKEDRDQV